MFYVATLISHPNRPAVTDAMAQKVARYLPHGRPVDWLAPGVATDIAFLGEEFEGASAGEADRLRKDLAQDIRDIVGGEPVDVVIQPQEGRRKKLFLADMDSTMIGQECIDELADYAGFKDRVATITERAMRGEIAFEPALRERVALLKGLPQRVIDTVIAERIRLTPGGPTLVATMRAHGAYTCLVSGGFTAFTSKIAAKIGFDENRANTLLAGTDGKLTGEVANPILGREAKLETLHELRARSIARDDTLAVGDGATEQHVPMITAAGLNASPSPHQARGQGRRRGADRSWRSHRAALCAYKGYRREENFVGSDEIETGSPVRRSRYRYCRCRYCRFKRHKARFAVGVGYQQHGDLLALGLQIADALLQIVRRADRLILHLDDHVARREPLVRIGRRDRGIDAGDGHAFDVVADLEFAAHVVGEARQFEAERLLHHRFLRRRRVFAGIGNGDLLAVFEAADRHFVGFFLALADDDDVDRLADSGICDDARQIVHLLDVMAVEFHDHVAGLDAGGLGRALVVDARHQRAARRLDAEAVGDVVGDLLDAHAEPAAPGLAVLPQLIEHRHRGVGRHGKADADRAARRRDDRGIDADDFTVEIEQRAAGIAAIDGGVGLNRNCRRGRN